MSDSDDELLKRLMNGATTLPMACRDMEQAAARIRELEAELDALKSDLSGYMGAANTYVNELHGVHTGTHVIVPVEPTEAMKNAGAEILTKLNAYPTVYEPEALVYRAMIRAAQEKAMSDTWPGGLCEYCGADEGRCYADCPSRERLQYEDRIRELEAALAEGMKWQPIETAPKDGTEVLAWAQSEIPGRGEYWGVARWATADPDFPRTIDGWFWPFAIRPTHWMPLPEPPQEKADETS